MTGTTAVRTIAEYRDLALREGLRVFEPARHGENNADGAVIDVMAGPGIDPDRDDYGGPYLGAVAGRRYPDETPGVL